MASTDFDSAQAWEVLLDIAKKMDQSKRLETVQIRRITDAAAILKSAQSTQRRRRYKSFLHGVLTRAGPGAVLLCASAFGQIRMTELRDCERDDLRNHIRAGEIPSGINDLAIRCGIPRSVDDLRHSLGAQDSSVRSPSDGQSHGSISTDPDLPSAAQQRVVENAKIHGVAKVFGDDLCGAVRRVEEGSRAAVTMAFPLWGGPVQCLMSLDICEPHVERLAMALFGAKVKWVGQVLHVVLEQGTTLITPNSEATLKGIGDERIARVLGTEIYGAIRECPVHVREIAEGKRATECVSMIFTKGGAFINLSLGLERSLQLQNKMYM
ncbi:uncharacterized protein PV06_08284 [Exophiala oligosperma]|uniref:Uncharacterized protein n=1 Tax=Exophiala oligosperma TaxID=215243 RepID=A0A0D2DW01_9EURO|nr:uncharacterized protein PV06_08284 [Exophiala oligosperma]KIW39694.1 hypothetical protein PV06_08284 [Exophiala oligosperma]